MLFLLLFVFQYYLVVIRVGQLTRNATQVKIMPAQAKCLERTKWAFCSLIVVSELTFAVANYYYLRQYLEKGVASDAVTYVRVIMLFTKEVVHLAVIVFFFWCIIKIWRYFSQNPNLRGNEKTMFLKASLSTLLIISSSIIASYQLYLAVNHGFDIFEKLN